MKKIVYTIIGLYITIGIFHIILWAPNKSMYEAFKKANTETLKKNWSTLKTLRLQVEAEDRKKLNHWLDQRNGYAEVPIDVAIDYYLREHHK